MSSIFDNLAKRSYLLDEKSTNWNLLKTINWCFIKLISPIM
jgi:hypothetical protein